MKKYLLILLYMVIPFWVFSQSSPLTITNSATYGGIQYIFSSSPAWYGFFQIDWIEIGSPSGSAAKVNGRGFLKFDLTGITPTILANMTKAELVLKTGNSFNVYPTSNDTVKISRTSVTDVLNNSQVASTYASLGSSSNTLITTTYLTPNTNSFSVSIDKTTISDHRNANKPLTMALMHKNEINRGIVIKEAKLVITYAPVTAPAAPTNVTVSDITANGCKLTWSASSGATQYEVMNGSAVLATVTGTNATISGLNQLTNYTLCVRAKNTAGTSGCSEVQFKTTHNVIISGSNSVCYGSPKSFSVTNPPPAGFTWSKSSNLNLSSTTSTSITVSAANSSSQGAGWVAINFGGTEVKRQDVWVGIPPNVTSISGTQNVQINQSYAYTANGISYTVPVSSFTWTVTGTAGVDYSISGQGNEKVYITFYNDNTAYQIGVKANNACGTSQYASYVVVDVGNRSSSGGFAYPNPVDDVLVVDLDAFAAANPALSSGARVSYDVRLYDGAGNMLQQQRAGGGTVKFDVLSLPNGFYYLHIYDGVIRTPEIQKIIVQH